MPEKILVTGSNGFLGSHTVRLLKENNFRVVTLDSTPGEGDHIQADVSEFDQSLKGFGTVIHLAALSSPSFCEENQELAWRVNVEGTRNILEKMGGRQSLVFASTSNVYDRLKNTPHSEDETLKPANYYGMTKKACEKLIEKQSRLKGFNACILRLFNVYGPGQRNNFLVPDVIEKYRTQENVEVTNPDVALDFIYVDDVLDALAKSKNKTGIYNIGSGEATKVREVYNTIRDTLESNARETEKGGDNYAIIADTTKSKKELGWRPNTKLKEGIERTIEYATRLE